MKKSDVYEIAIKILGLYLVVIVISQLREVFTYSAVLLQTKNDPDSFQGIDQTPVFIVTIISFLVLVAFAGLLIFRTRKVTSLICDKQDYEETAKLFVNRKVIYEIALTIVGLLMILLTLPDFALKLKNYLFLVQNDSSTNVYDNSFLIIAGLKIIMGFLTLSFSKFVSRSLTANVKEER